MKWYSKPPSPHTDQIIILSDIVVGQFDEETNLITLLLLWTTFVGTLAKVKLHLQAFQLKKSFLRGLKFVQKGARYWFKSKVLSSTSGNSSKFFVSSIAVTLTGKAAGRSLIAKKRLSNTVVDGDDDEDASGLPDVLPVDCVEPGQLFHLVHTRDPEWRCF